MKEYYDITFGELLEIKKIVKMPTIKALPKIQKLREQYNLEYKQAVNLLAIARNFNPKYILL